MAWRDFFRAIFNLAKLLSNAAATFAYSSLFALTSFIAISARFFASSARFKSISKECSAASAKTTTLLCP
jgi:hypothetical protein